MADGSHPFGVELTEEEAFALLGMCLTSPQVLDAISERALKKLAGFCISKSNYSSRVAESEKAEPIQCRAL